MNDPQLTEDFQEAAWNVLDGLGWGGALRIGYSGPQDAIEQFEEGLDALLAAFREDSR